MVINEKLKLRSADFAQHPVRHRDQNRQLDDRGRLNRRIMRDVASRAPSVRTAAVMVSEIRLHHDEDQGKYGHTS